MDKRKLETILSKTQEMEALYKQTLEDNQKLEEFRLFLKEASGRMEKLMGYYQQDWLNHRDALSTAGDDFEIMGEDQIYDSLTAQNIEMRRILRDLAVIIAD